MAHFARPKRLEPLPVGNVPWEIFVFLQKGAFMSTFIIFPRSERRAHQWEVRILSWVHRLDDAWTALRRVCARWWVASAVAQAFGIPVGPLMPQFWMPVLSVLVSLAPVWVLVVFWVLVAAVGGAIWIHDRRSAHCPRCGDS